MIKTGLVNSIAGNESSNWLYQTWHTTENRIRSAGNPSPNHSRTWAARVSCGTRLISKYTKTLVNIQLTIVTYRIIFFVATVYSFFTKISQSPASLSCLLIYLDQFSKIIESAGCATSTVEIVSICGHSFPCAVVNIFRSFVQAHRPNTHQG